jgi:pyrimidine-nucleoside phosphorylase
VDLGAGRRTKDDTVDPTAGLTLVKKPGDAVTSGDTLAYIHTKHGNRIADFRQRLLDAYTFSEAPPQAPHPVLDRYTPDGWDSR